MEVGIAIKNPKIISLSVLAESSSAAEMITGEGYTRLNEATAPRAREVAVEIEGLSSLEANSLAIGIKIT